MKGEENAWNSLFSVWAAVLACCCLMMLGCRKASDPGAQGANAGAMAGDPATVELRAIGDKVVAAVVARDINTLLEYDHDPDDQASLKNKTGDLYCYLFDSSCIPGAKRRAVYEIFSTAPKLGIEASVANVQGKNYGLLMFYDKSQISGQDLYSPDFLCTDKALKATTTWRFIQTNGKWSTSTLFEYKTERPCKTSGSGSV